MTGVYQEISYDIPMVGLITWSLVKDLAIAPGIGAAMAYGLAVTVELFKARGPKCLYGDWLCAVQPVYYLKKYDHGRGKSVVEDRWHVRRIRITPSWRGLKARTLKASNKLQWVWYPKLRGQTFLVGNWHSTRKTSVAHGFMSVQVSRDGRYMFGHDLGVSETHEESNFGVLLLGQSEADLQSAWMAMATGFRKMRPLNETIDFR